METIEICKLEKRQWILLAGCKWICFRRYERVISCHYDRQGACGRRCKSSPSRIAAVGIRPRLSRPPLACRSTSSARGEASGCLRNLLEGLLLSPMNS